MTRLRATLLIIILAATVAGPAVPQSDDRGLVQRTLEDSLSGDGRTVRVTGFSGALSSEASLEELTVADANGVWLTLRDATLNWQRTALLRGRVEVAELRAGEIILDRLPQSEPGAPDAEASGFSLPDLPVAINIGALTAERIELGPTVIGQAAVLSLSGSVRLEGGEGAGQLEAQRIDDRDDTFTVSASYANSTEELAVDLLLNEAPGGLVSNLLNLPGDPSVRLAAEGAGPLGDFAASLALQTDGQDRLEGTLTLNDDDGARAFAADVTGDIAPLFAPDFRDFFGDDIALMLDGRALPDGVTEISEFALSAAAIDLDGALRIGADGLPLDIAVTGTIAAPDGGPVRLPRAGEATEIRRADLEVFFDAAAGDEWTGSVVIEGLSQPGFRAEAATLTGSGRILRAPLPQITADLDFSAEALDLSDASADAALGETVEGRVSISAIQGSPISLTDLRVTGETYGLEGSAQISTIDGGLEITTELAATASDLSAFSGIAGRRLGGAVSAEVSGTVTPLAGTFTLTANGQTRDVTVDQPEADRLLSGTADLTTTLRRTTDGTFVDTLRLDGDAARVQASARLGGEDSRATASVTLIDTGVIAEDVAGPAQLELAAEQTGAFWDIDGTLDAPDMAATFDLVASLATDVPVISGDITASAATIAPFSQRAGRQIAGGIDLSASGEVAADLSRFDATATFTGQDLRIAQPEADRLLAGTTRVEAAVRQSADGLFVDTLRVNGDAARITAQGRMTEGSSQGTATVTLIDTGVISEDVRAPAELEVAATQTDALWEIAGTLAAPDASAEFDLTADTSNDVPVISGDITADAADLAPFSDRAGRALGGGISLDLSGEVSTDLERVDIAGDIIGQDLKLSQPDADRLLRGRATLTADLARDGDSYTVRTFTFEAPEVSADISGAVGRDSGTVEIAARLADISPYAAGFRGPATVAGTLGRLPQGNWRIDLSGTGPGNIRADTAGTVAENLSTADVTLTGSAPLSIANRFIAPRTVSGTLNFDLALRGEPGLPALSGQLTTQGARAASPTERIVLSAIDANVGLASGRAQLDVRATAEGGGSLRLTGPVALTDPFLGDLALVLNRLAVRDPALYETTANGRIQIEGPLASSARISGRIDLGETNVQIPSGSISGVGSIPNIIHQNEPAAVRQTRARAGLVTSGTSNGSGGGGGAAYPLDLRVVASNRIFIRGRGLEAELGGGLRLRGTTDNIVPDGQFDLIRGRLDILGRRLILTEGRATLQGDFDPTLFFVAETQAEDVTVRIIVEGQASEPIIRFLSDPDLPEDEVLARLLFGRGIDTLSPLQAAQLAAAVATLAGQGGEGIVSRLRRNFGLDDLDVTTDEAGNVAVRAGAYLSDNVYTDVTVGGAGEAEVNLNLDLTPSVTVKGGVDNEGRTGLGIFFERDY